ncbi:hypothetical protein TWF569_010495 [Orbilia oligospora]|uniref:Uncharacterized protein n=1 Tax=Orbilia oligospora TaxID=2813651 RepID=A0A7C8IXA7_ORBOL|nr:hypothetical protein TWF102_002541 [Orbilia oligospora]KAF3080573.1 hypothetical protein TWF706_002708 [Orbilia oligospora]KAF3117902.1 hypothetical protein TWF103_004565 [Orbilia oligospora]KAF3120975.1 hypothetical protein TWF594_003468 [Orbilia oligospora]KAF3131183.1 hypothetical protein TWF703_007887 [Orbilia oligospora]
MAPTKPLEIRSKSSNIAFGPTLGGLIGGFTFIALCVIGFCLFKRKFRRRRRKARRQEYLKGKSTLKVSESPVSSNGNVNSVEAHGKVGLEADMTRDSNEV